MAFASWRNRECEGATQGVEQFDDKALDDGPGLFFKAARATPAFHHLGMPVFMLKVANLTGDATRLA